MCHHYKLAATRREPTSLGYKAQHLRPSKEARHSLRKADFLTLSFISLADSEAAFWRTSLEPTETELLLGLRFHQQRRPKSSAFSAKEEVSF